MTFARLLAAGLGTGWAPRAPGTFGSLLGLALGSLLLAQSRLLLLVGAILATGLGFWAIRRTLRQPWHGSKGTHDDPGWIVIDEVAGQMLALLAVPRVSAAWLLAAFGLFRLFDIAKPGPIGWADRQGGVAGIMADDILAGAAAGFSLLAAHIVLKAAS